MRKVESGKVVGKKEDRGVAGAVIPRRACRRLQEHSPGLAGREEGGQGALEMWGDRASCRGSKAPEACVGSGGQ